MACIYHPPLGEAQYHACLSAVTPASRDPEGYNSQKPQAANGSIEQGLDSASSPLLGIILRLIPDQIP